MKQLTSIIWKEWREAQAYLWIALGIFVGLPMIGAFEGRLPDIGRSEMLAWPWVACLGGVLTVFIAAAVACRDYNGRVEDFWRSRPISVGRWLAVKFLVGLLIAITGCVVPLIVEMMFNHRAIDIREAVWRQLTWIAIYGLTFLAGCLTRRTAHTAMLGLALLLLFYFLPTVYPPLRWLDETYIGDSNPREGIFATIMTATTLAAMVTAFISVRRNWRVIAGPKLLYGTVSLALLIILTSAAFQLGTNLPIVNEIDLPKGQRVQSLYHTNDGYYAVTEEGPTPRLIYPLMLSTTKEELHIGAPFRSEIFYDHLKHLSASKSVSADRYWIGYARTDKITAVTLHWDSPSDPKPENERKLGELENDSDIPGLHSMPGLLIWQNRLYVIGDRLTIFNINDRSTPKLLSERPLNFSFYDTRRWTKDGLTMTMPPIPELPVRARLKFMVSQLGASSNVDGDLMAFAPGGPSPFGFENERRSWNPQSIEQYRLTSLTDDTAHFEKSSEYRTTPLESISWGYPYCAREIQDNALYVYAPGHKPFNDHVTVFDTSDPRALRPIAHFAAPDIAAVCPLPDGRAIIAGTKIWLVGSPRRGHQ